MPCSALSLPQGSGKNLLLRLDKLSTAVPEQFSCSILFSQCTFSWLKVNFGCKQVKIAANFLVVTISAWFYGPLKFQLFLCVYDSACHGACVHSMVESVLVFHIYVSSGYWVQVVKWFLPISPTPRTLKSLILKQIDGHHRVSLLRAPVERVGCSSPGKFCLLMGLGLDSLQSFWFLLSEHSSLGACAKKKGSWRLNSIRRGINSISGGNRCTI